MKRFFISPLLLVLLCTAAAQAEPEGRWQAILQWDNDLLTGSDRDYTNGARLGLLRNLDADRSTHNALQRALYKFSGADRAAPLGLLQVPEREPRAFAWGIGLTQLMYTPDDPSASRAPAGQRPYAGWLGLETSLHVKSADAATSITVSAGSTGAASYAQDAQDWVHTHISGSPIFQGWDSQVPGEFTLNLHLEHQRRIPGLDGASWGPLEMNGYYEWGAALGNFRTEAHLGGLLRWGYQLPRVYAIPRVEIGSHGHALFDEADSGDRPFSIYSFAGLRATAVAHDITLDGPVFNNFDTGVSSEPLVGELLFGLGIRWSGYSVSFARSYRSNEFKGQRENQAFGSIMLRADFPF